MDDWKSALGSLLASGDLPAGEESPASEKELRDESGKKENLRIIREKKGRGGKTALIIEGFLCSDDDLSSLAAWLKGKLGVGGSARGGEILIQGNDPERLAGLLRQKGYKVKFGF